MGKTALLFPGQGSQFVGMGRDLYQGNRPARALIDRADEVLGLPLSGLMFGSASLEPGEDAEAIQGDPAEHALKQTEITQPALYTHSLAVMAALTDGGGLDFDMVAGHSLGEYSALAAAGAISFEDGLRLVRRRGELMAEAGSLQPGTMAAIIGLDDDAVAAACASVSTGVVQPANYNSPGQVVISGDPEAVAQAMEAATAAGARRAIALPVSGAFHSPLMAHARDGLADALASVSISAPSRPVFLNVSASAETDPERIRESLLEQLLAPVRWSQSLIAMQEFGATTYVEIGAGKVLGGLVKRTLGRAAETYAIGSSQDISLFTTDE